MGDAPGLGVEPARLAHAAAGHRQLAEQGVREHGEIGRPAGDELARLAGAVGGRVEPGDEPEVAGHAVQEGAADHAGVVGRAPMRMALAKVRRTSGPATGSTPLFCRTPLAITRSTSKAGSGVVEDAALRKALCASR